MTIRAGLRERIEHVHKKLLDFFDSDAPTLWILSPILVPVCRQACGRGFSPPSAQAVPAGAGLGLVIAADFVRSHGGAITLVPAAEEENSGAKFHITLPQDAIHTQ